MRKTTASRLRHRLTLQQETHTPDGAGGYVKSWNNVVDLWAEIVPVVGSSQSTKTAGRETLFAGQMQAETTHRVLLRYRDGVTSAMRFVFEARIFNIRSVATSGERWDALEILVQEGIAT